MAGLRSICKLALVVGVSTVALAACGDSGSGSGDDREQISSAFEDVSAAVRAAQPARVCAELGANAREQVAGTAQGAFTTCTAAIRPMLEALRDARRGTDPPTPEIARVKLEQRAVVTVDVDGRTVKVPFVKGGSGWKLDSFYGLAPTPATGPE